MHSLVCPGGRQMHITQPRPPALHLTALRARLSCVHPYPYQPQTANGAAAAGTPTLLADSTANTADARIYEYVSACNPDMPPIPALAHPPQLHEEGA